MTVDPPSVPDSDTPSSQPMERSRQGLLSRWRCRVLIALAVLFTLICGVTARLFVWPTTGMPARVDAIVVPGGPGDRIATAITLAKQGRAQYLVLSEGEYVPPQLCGAHVGTATVLCFMPNPDTTQGEAEAAARLAQKYGFRSIVLVTTPDQTWRAELRFRRCYRGSIYAVTTPLPTHMWPLMISYQWAASLKAEIANRRSTELFTASVSATSPIVNPTSSADRSEAILAQTAPRLVRQSHIATKITKCGWSSRSCCPSQAWPTSATASKPRTTSR
jgi:uncharacterized SAM-binding protein YcdF (DUF218 family)